MWAGIKCWFYVYNRFLLALKSGLTSVWYASLSSWPEQMVEKYERGMMKSKNESIDKLKLQFH